MVEQYNVIVFKMPIGYFSLIAMSSYTFQRMTPAKVTWHVSRLKGICSTYLLQVCNAGIA